jgi:peptidyl-prolyl cis-trans isomerase D
VLDFMRRNARSWVVSAVLVFICFSLAFFLGGGGRIGAGRKAIATVGDEEISPAEFQFARTRNEAFYREQYGDKLTPELLKALDIPSMTLNQLVDSATLRQEAERLGLTVPDEALRQQIREIDAFNGPGGFSPSRYRAMLQRQNMTPARFERSLRQEMLVSQLVDVIRSGVHVTEDEAFQDYRRQNDKLVLSYLAIEGSSLEDQVEVKDEALQSYFHDHSEEYRKPDSVSVRYLVYTPAEFANPKSVTEEAIEEYYYLHVDDEFTTGEQVAVRHILKKFNADDPASKEAARKAIEAIQKKLEAGADFAELAREESDDTATAANGGDLGRFGRGKMTKPFEDAAFALKVGQTSDIVETRFGFHLIQSYEHIAAGRRKLEDVHDEIAAKLAKEGTLAEAFDAAAEDALTLHGDTSIATIAESRKLEVHTTPPFSEGDTVPGVGAAPAFVDAALALQEVGDSSDPVHVGDAYYLLELAERTDSYVPQLAGVRETVEKNYRKEQATRLAQKKADALLEDLKAGKSIDEVAASSGLEKQETDAFTRLGDFVPGVGNLPGLKQLAFDTDEDGAVIPRSFVLNDEAYVFVRTGHADATHDDFEKVKDQRIESLRQRRGEAAVAAFLATLKEKTDISFDQDMIKQFVR